MTIAEVEDVAHKLLYFSKRYQLLADSMKETKTPRIATQNFSSLNLGMGNIMRAINKAVQGYDTALLVSGVFADENVQAARDKMSATVEELNKERHEVEANLTKKYIGGEEPNPARKHPKRPKRSVSRRSPKSSG